MPPRKYTPEQADIAIKGFENGAWLNDVINISEISYFIASKIKTTVKAKNAPFNDLDDNKKRLAQYHIRKNYDCGDFCPKAEIAKVDAERKKIRDRLEVLQEEVRKPLTDWENKEKDRIAKHESDLNEIEQLATFCVEPTTDLIEMRLDKLSKVNLITFEEFSKRANASYEKAKQTLEEMLSVSKKRDADRLELEALRKAEDERKQRERDEEIKREAAEKARKEADEEAAAKAKAEKDKADKEKRDIEEKAEQDRKDKEDAERRANEADAAAKKAEADRIAAEKKAEADRIEAQEKADRDRKEAVERAKKEEHDRIADEEKKKADEIAKREADKNHRAKINSAALTVIQSIVDECLSQKTDIAKAIIVSIAKGDVPNIKINY